MLNALAEPLSSWQQAVAVWLQAWGIWVAGGWAMIPIAFDAAVMFGVGVSVWLRLRARGFRSVPEKVWRLWLDHPDHREGPIGELIDAATDAKTINRAVRITK